MAAVLGSHTVQCVYYAHDMDAGGWVFPTAMMLLLFALFVVAIVWFARNQSAHVPPRPDRHGDGRTARDLLDRRLVSGEISEDEYRRLRATLSETPASGQPVEPAPGH